MTGGITIKPISMRTICTERIKHEIRGTGVLVEEPDAVKIQRNIDGLLSHFGGDACKIRLSGYERKLEKLNRS